ncbi:hypothetical protein C1I98_25270 [Spongiactinospora gelatinilytica]|uniref:Major facilitator superfamily (MFS) profile domain-containing protein n=1 Tax=Spongiactinospora gelatinilytica TaxID=2666298 RepID=A0A2W2GJH7_9ACTN|nr:MFS transporter [Spongiactinospora gelatinilytica]PZG37500.1 hypothetical protein C1I98_25270 [Spongiactinospora gelatinilytica]
MRNNPILVLAAVLLSSVSLPITLTGASVALVEIASDLQADLAPVQWVVTGYNATFASFMPASGSLADLIGRRRIYTSGLIIFVVSGLLSTVATDIVLLDVVRALAGVGGAAAAASGSALLAASFQGPARARVFGLFGTALGIGLAFGPTIAGVLVNAFGWRAVFGVPSVACLLVLAVVRLLPESRDPRSRRVDWAGTVSFTAGLLLLIFGFVEGPALGWASPAVLGTFVAFRPPGRAWSSGTSTVAHSSRAAAGDSAAGGRPEHPPQAGPVRCPAAAGAGANAPSRQVAANVRAHPGRMSPSPPRVVEPCRDRQR